MSTAHPRRSAWTVFASIESVLLVIVVIAGAVVTIVDPDTLPFSDYLQDIVILAGALGIGGGIAAAGRALTPPAVRPLDPEAQAAGQLYPKVTPPTVRKEPSA